MKSSNQLRADLYTAIWEAWEANPELRFCQLIGNSFNFDDLYYVEDTELLEALKNKYEK
ncbi:hypothetical protein LCGC14_2127460 [marine sediment metagenome]|uniref:Uncharacterized protein n=1 Tax=marine sediment metagenome TaxID=412755 RepID=A0A0F9E2G2_9ZZZZ